MQVDTNIEEVSRSSSALPKVHDKSKLGVSFILKKEFPGKHIQSSHYYLGHTSLANTSHLSSSPLYCQSYASARGYF